MLFSVNAAVRGLHQGSSCQRGLYSNDLTMYLPHWFEPANVKRQEGAFSCCNCCRIRLSGIKLSLLGRQQLKGIVGAASKLLSLDLKRGKETPDTISNGVCWKLGQFSFKHTKTFPKILFRLGTGASDFKKWGFFGVASKLRVRYGTHGGKRKRNVEQT